MTPIKRRLKGILAFLRSIRAALKPKIRRFQGNSGKNGKRALISYLPDAINMSDNARAMKGHSNWWECREIARILSGFGYNVDAISCHDSTTVPKGKYDLVLDIAENLQRLAATQDKGTELVLLLTGSHYDWTKRQEALRANAFMERHHVPYRLRYQTVSTERLDRSLDIADHCLLIGNETTLSTYPERFRSKITTIPVSRSETNHRKIYGAKRSDSFLYFSSPRNVLKGLDLVLDVFMKHPEWRLDVVGNVESETDFMRAYPTLEQAPNIRLHGFLIPSSRRFSLILDRCDAIILPSCSEGTSTSVLTCTCSGLFPIISPNCGVSLPEGTGTWIESLTPEGVESAIRRFRDKPWNDVRDEADAIRAFHDTRHSRNAFSRAVCSELLRLLSTNESPSRPDAGIQRPSCASVSQGGRKDRTSETETESIQGKGTASPPFMQNQAHW